jgi:transcriptional regulator with XRE-family HTH domain
VSETIGRRIHRVLHEVGWSQNRLATELDVEESTVGRWVADRTRPEADSMLAMAEHPHLRINPGWLLLGGEQPMRLGGVSPRQGDRSAQDTAERAHREYVVCRLVGEGYSPSMVERVVPTGAEMLATLLLLCRKSLQYEIHATRLRIDGQSVQVINTTEVSHGIVFGQWTDE